ncbi:hypothetical protein H0H87_005332, partial [Tephrocybe sp. NHM501043]
VLLCSLSHNNVTLTYYDGSPTPSLFALIIGINKYADPSVPDLLGAVNDAIAVKHFLASNASLAKNRIIILRDEEATQDGIMSALRSLAYNSAIGTQDPILIYYAGYGSEVASPITTNISDGTIQMLLPYDFESKGSKGAQGQGVLYPEISQVLAEVAMRKSDNIVSYFRIAFSF